VPRPRELAAFALLKLVVSLGVLAVGYEGVSDDDYARVVIAQTFAHAPALDPSGTSWLPLPFWLNGGVMMLAGTDVWVARAVAVALGVFSLALFWLSARWLTRDASEARVATIIAAVMPWSARLGVSMVPELPALACSLLAMASLAKPAPPSARLLGAALLGCACLSRYEPWFIAFGFAIFCLRDAALERAKRAVSLGSAALSLAAPIAWTLWNQHAHGSFFHYLDSVAAYKDAVDNGDLTSRALAYVFAAGRAEPELLWLAVFLCWRMFRGRSETVRAELLSFQRPALLSLFLFVALTVSSIRGGAPTHHPERALLVIHLLLAMVTGALGVRVYRDRRFGEPRRLLIGLACVAPLLYMLRFWVLYRESFAHRREELAIGKRVVTAIPAGERVLYFEPPDYGHYAIAVGSGEPWRFEIFLGGADMSREDRFAIASQMGTRYVLLANGPDENRGAIFCEAGPTPWRPGFPICLYAVE
jgi:hypothetical protein